MKRWFRNIFFFVALMHCAGCATTQKVRVFVFDEHTGKPINRASVGFNFDARMMVLNEGNMPLVPQGETNNEGVWETTVPARRSGSVWIEKEGYRRRFMPLDERSMINGRVEVAIIRNAAGP